MMHLPVHPDGRAKPSLISCSVLLMIFAAALVGCRGRGSISEACPHCAGASETQSADAGKTAPASAFITEWTPPERRKSALADFVFENQDGLRISSSDLRGAPAAVSFIYTRCQNQRKCPLVAQTMAKRHRTAHQSNLSPRPWILLMTYDPEFDTPAVLKTFGESHDFRGADNAMLLRTEPRTKEQLISNLHVAVNYDERGVNLHGLQLILLDKHGRLVRRYHSLLWDNADVLNDLSRLAAE